MKIKDIVHIGEDPAEEYENVEKSLSDLMNHLQAAHDHKENNKSYHCESFNRIPGIIDGCRNILGMYRRLIKKSDESPDAIDIGKIVNHMAKTLRSHDNKYDIYAQAEKGLLVLAKELEIYRIILNLCTNAIEAIQGMPDKGRVELILSRTNIGNCIYFSDEYARLDITDNGEGIPIEHMGSVFNEKFTTKGLERGLGLSIVRKIARRNGWPIEVKQKRPGMEYPGTVFSLYIPLYRAA